MEVSSPHIQQNVCYVKVGVYRNWKQLFLSVTYSVFIGAGMRHKFILFFTYIFASYQRNILEKKFWTHEILTKKHFGLTKCLRQKIWTHQIPTRTGFGPKKYPREKISNPRNSHEKTFGTLEIPTRNYFRPTKARWYDGTRSTRPTHQNVCIVKMLLRHSRDTKVFLRTLIFQTFRMIKE